MTEGTCSASPAIRRRLASSSSNSRFLTKLFVAPRRRCSARGLLESERSSPMVGTLLARGMLIGLLAGLLSFAFLKIVGEPAVDRATAFETQVDKAKAKAKMDEAMAKGMQ